MMFLAEGNHTFGSVVLLYVPRGVEVVPGEESLATSRYGAAKAYLLT